MNGLKVIILNYNTEDLLDNCLHSIYSQSWRYRHKVIVVDNGSSDRSIDMVKKKYPQAGIIQSQKNLGFAGGNNLALIKSDSTYSMLLNSDTIVYPKSLDNLVKFMDQGSFGIGACRLVGKDGKTQFNAGDLPTFVPLFIWLSGLDDVLLLLREKLPSFHRRFESFYKGNREVGWVSGSAMVIREDVIEKIGGMDEKIFMYCEDVDYCWRAREKGFKVGWTDRAEIKHLGGGSSSDPAFNQWVGEYRGLQYLYKKFYGKGAAVILKLVINTFVALRICVFFILGKTTVSKTYAKVLVNI